MAMLAAIYPRAFLAGLVSFLSPCVLPLVPGYLSLMTGVSVSDLRDGAPIRRVLPPTLAFVGGFGVVFVLLGAAASSVGRFLITHQPTLNRVAGAVVVMFGVFLLAGMAFRFPFLFREARFHPAVHEIGVFAAPVMGAAFAFGWTPCIGPILGTILTLASTEGQVGQGMALLATYSLGLAVPFIAASLALGKLTAVFRWFSRHGRAITAVSAALLVGFGLLMLTNQVTQLSGWLLRNVPGFGWIDEHFL